MERPSFLDSKSWLFSQKAAVAKEEVRPAPSSVARGLGVAGSV